jgi:hypothetical protein
LVAGVGGDTATVSEDNTSYEVIKLKK